MAVCLQLAFLLEGEEGPPVDLDYAFHGVILTFTQLRLQTQNRENYEEPRNYLS